MLPRNLDGSHHIVSRAGHDDADRLDLVNAGVGGVQRARNAIEPDLALDVLLELALQVQDLAPFDGDDEVHLDVAVAQLLRLLVPGRVPERE
jgi:hypothetical protein